MSTISDMVMASEEADDGMEQWEPEPPPDGGYEVTRIHPYGEGAEDFVDNITSMARHDPDMARISAEAVGFPLDEKEVTSVRLGGLRQEWGNLILERREKRKEVLEAERKERGELIKRAIDDLVDSLKEAEEDAAEQAETQ